MNAYNNNNVSSLLSHADQEPGTVLSTLHIYTHTMHTLTTPPPNICIYILSNIIMSILQRRKRKPKEIKQIA